MGLICPECGGKAIVVKTRTNRKKGRRLGIIRVRSVVTNSRHMKGYLLIGIMRRDMRS